MLAGMEIRPITDDEVPAFRAAMITTFGGDVASDPEGDERFRALVDRSRAFAAFDRGRVVATAATFDLTLTTCGGTIAMAGLTNVTVRPTHRRRGIMRALIELHLADARRRGVPVSGLWASEGGIYGRFGYGLSVEADELTVEAAGLEIDSAALADELEPLDPGEAPGALDEIFARVVPARPGMFARSAAWWRYRRFADRPDQRGSASPRRYVRSRRGDTMTGYLVYRQEPDWSSQLPAGKVAIEDLIAVDARAEIALWRFATSIDLFPKVSWPNAPVDSILPWIASDPRRVVRQRTDTMWLRVDDVAATLSARRYGADGALRLGVVDDEVAGQPAVYALEVDAGAGRCHRVDSGADLLLDRAALGAIYLGGVPASRLARAGRVAGGDAALASADRLFSWPVAPWCQEMF